MSLRRLVIASFIIFIVFGVGIQCVMGAKIVEVKINGQINEGSAVLMEEAFKKADEVDADAVLILIDTPGGLVTSMKKMVNLTLDSDVPVITYVYPRGAFAASAGSFLLISGNIAVMSNGTATGAATPIGMIQPAENKTINFITKYARSIAEDRNRPVDIVEKFVTEGKSLSANEALESGVIDLIIDSKTELFEKINGKTVSVKGNNVTLSFGTIEMIKIEKPLKVKVLELITNPQIASILLLIGIYGIIFGLTSPGIMAETVGAICLVIGFIGLGEMDINYIGILLLIMSLVFLLAELMTPTYGVLGTASVICIALGFILLYEEPLMPESFYSSFPGLIMGISLGFAGIMTFLIIKMTQLRRLKKKVGEDALMAEKGEIISVKGNKYQARVRGEIWNVLCDEELEKGDRVEVVGIDGLTLTVRKI